MHDRQGLRDWRRRFVMRDLFDLVELFYEHDPVAEACRAAVGRLRRRPAQVVDGLYYEGLSPAEVAARQQVTRSTVYNTGHQARRNLHDDDVL